MGRLHVLPSRIITTTDTIMMAIFHSYTHRKIILLWNVRAIFWLRDNIIKAITTMDTLCTHSVSLIHKNCQVSNIRDPISNNKGHLAHTFSFSDPYKLLCFVWTDCYLDHNLNYRTIKRKTEQSELWSAMVSYVQLCSAMVSSVEVSKRISSITKWNHKCL
jgi:hypothetical protein